MLHCLCSYKGWLYADNRQPKCNCNYSTLGLQPPLNKQTRIWTNLPSISVFRQTWAICSASVRYISCQMSLPWHFCPHRQVLLISIPEQTPSTVNKDQCYLHWSNWDQSASFPHTTKARICYSLFLCNVMSLWAIGFIIIFRCQEKQSWMRMFDKVTGKRIICMLLFLGESVSLFHKESSVCNVIADIMNRSCTDSQ